MLDLILAGILSLPALLVTVATLPLLFILSAPAAYILLSRHQSQPTKANEEGEKGTKGSADKSYHAIITGGSSGIGLAIAQLSMKQKNISKITLLARNPKKLEAAREKVLQEAAKGSAPAKTVNDIEVQTFSVDVSDYKAVKEAALKIFNPKGNNNNSKERVLLFSCAGEAVPQYFDKLQPEQFFQQIQVNQLGGMNMTHAFLPYLAKGSTICFCSSAAGLVGVFGYTAYSPTKFALRGFAEALHAELLDSGIFVQVAFPPDTDTPGFAEENKTKPRECHLISEQAGGLAKPEDVARTMLASAMKKSPPFQVYFDFDGFLLCTMTSGFSPVTSYWDAVVQLSGLMTLARWVALFYLRIWHSIIRKCRSEETKKTGQEELNNNNNNNNHKSVDVAAHKEKPKKLQD